MKTAGFYAIGCIAVGILQVIDGILLILAHGSINKFNTAVALIEFFWLPLCIIMAFAFYRLRLSLLSPVSYTVYGLSSLIIGSLTRTPNENAGAISVPIVFAIIGTLFGIYYVIINDRLYRQTKVRR